MTHAIALSVIVPVHDASPLLGETLAAILASEMPRSSYELIVVDDASGDRSITVAARHADTIIRIPGRPAGPAYARNRGAERARGQLVAFVDADVLVRPDTLPRMAGLLSSRPDLDAIVASYDDQPTQQNTVSQYWNLLQHLAGRHSAGVGAHPIAGCSMLRRASLMASRMYDEWRFRSDCVEGLELGQRMSSEGHAVLLSGELRVTHMRRWDTPSLLRDVWGRSEAIARSLGYQRTRRQSRSEVLFTLGALALPVVCLVASLALIAPTGSHASLPVKVLGLLGLLVAANLRVYRFLARARGFLFAVRVAPLHVLSQLVAVSGLCTGWILRDAVGDGAPDATTEAFAEVGLEMWPPVPRRL